MSEIKENQSLDLSFVGIAMKALVSSDHFGVSENVEIAKGKFKNVYNMKDAQKSLKRRKEWRKRFS